MNQQGDLLKALKEDENWWTLYTDGASRGNPGSSGAGAVLKNPEGLPLADFNRFIRGL